MATSPTDGAGREGVPGAREPTEGPAEAGFDPVELSVWNHLFAGVAEEMGAALGRSALSPNIKERRDRSCAVFDARGRLVAQAAHIPVHLGATPLSVRAVLANVPLGDGEIAIVNDPFAGGTHLPDVTLVGAVDLPVEGRAPERFYVASRAHHADVGGRAPGSFAVARAALDAGGDGDPAGGVPEAEPPEIAMGPRYRLARAHVPRLAGRAPPVVTQSPPPTLTIDDEGVRIPPSRLTDELVERFARSTRTPDERRGDLAAQRASIAVGRSRLLALAERHGAEALAAQSRRLSAWGERLMRAAIARIPSGVYAFADSLDDDGAGTSDIAIRVLLTVLDGRVTCDFSDSDPESPGSLNAALPVTLSSVLYAFRLLLDEDAPGNEGLMAPIEVIAPPGSIVNARPPRAVAAGNVETSQRIVDVVLGALAQALPGRVPAASAGTMSNLMLGGVDARGTPARPFAYYETIAGGAGGSKAGAGASAIQTHMTNTLSTPIEALEHEIPVRVVRSAVRRGSGGVGRFAGGDGVERTIELLAPATVTLVGDRRRRPPYGLGGGGPGEPGVDTLERDGRAVRLPAKCTFEGREGDRLTIATPGGGGHGDPRGR